MTPVGAYIDLFWPSIVGGAAIAVQAGLLSPFVVLKRMAFIGQGVSHAAFGGVGLAVALGITGGGLLASAGYYLLVGGFCIATAIGIALLSDNSEGDRRRTLRPDTVIGVFLVASMALGSILLFMSYRRGAPGARAVRIEDWLFGSITVVGVGDALVAVGAAAVIGGGLWMVRRPLTFWAADERGARAFGVRTRVPQLALLVMLGASIVVSMKLAGAVLATALLVLPGAAALQLTRRMGPTFAVSTGVSVVSMMGGLGLSFMAGDLPPGPCIVAVLVALFVAGCAARRLGLSSGAPGAVA